MKSPPLYRVRSFPLKLLIENEYELCSEIAHDRSFEILQQDNLLFRHIRHITGNSRKYNPYVVFVDTHGVTSCTDAVKHVVAEGIVIDGRRFLFGERSASMTRNGIFSFIDADIFDELTERITMGFHPEKEVLSKYYAYRGLAFSSCHCLEKWAHNMPKMIVVPDRMVTIKDQRIRYLYDSKSTLTNESGVPFEWTQKDIAETTTDITINAFDGCGLIHPDLAQEVADMIGSNSPVTSFIFRGPFIKGCLHAVDYRAFFAENGIGYIEDVWHRWHSTDSKMIILTESMVKAIKLLRVYGDGRDWDRYLDLIDKYDWTVGVAKYNFSFDEEPIYTRMNYQILQDLDLPYAEFAKLADESKRWAERIMDGDPLFTYAFLGLTADRCNPVSAYAKAALKDPQMLNEPNVRKYLRDSLSKYIDEFKCGKLWAKCGFKFLVPDLIMLMEHIGGLPLKGCLEPGEFYSRDADGAFEGTHLIERNPHICRSEHALMTAKVSPDIDRYFGHMSNIAMVNSKSLIAQRLNGADFDGDLVLVAKNEIMFKGVHSDLPIVLDIDDKITALVEPDTVEGRTALTLRTLGNLIGKYSNCSSAYHNKTPASPEQKELYMKYVDIISICTGKAIDASKTGVIFKIPYYIEKYAKPLPYFMKYRGSYYDKQRLSKSYSNMNRLCMALEKWHRELAWKKPAKFDYTIMLDDTICVPDEMFEAVEKVFLAYNKEMKDVLADQRRIRKYEDDDVREQLSRYDAINFIADFGEIYERYKKLCAEICPDVCMLANICVRLVYEKYPKSRSKFPWIVAEQGILKNIKQVPMIQLPRRDINGEYEYLGRRYSIVDVDMTEPELDIDGDEFSEFDEDWEIIDID